MSQQRDKHQKWGVFTGLFRTVDRLALWFGSLPGLVQLLSMIGVVGVPSSVTAYVLDALPDYWFFIPVTAVFIGTTVVNLLAWRRRERGSLRFPHRGVWWLKRRIWSANPIPICSEDRRTPLMEVVNQAGTLGQIETTDLAVFRCPRCGRDYRINDLNGVPILTSDARVEANNVWRGLL